MDTGIVKDWKFWTALGAGFITGAVTALLYAPMQGAELRGKVGELATNVAGSATETANKVAVAASKSVSVYGAVARNAGTQVERLFSAVAAGVDEANRVRNEFKSKVEASKNAS